MEGITGTLLRFKSGKLTGAGWRNWRGTTSSRHRRANDTIRKSSRGRVFPSPPDVEVRGGKWLHVCNLPGSVTAKCLRELFGQFGFVGWVRLEEGDATVQMGSEEEATHGVKNRPTSPAAARCLNRRLIDPWKRKRLVVAAAGSSGRGIQPLDGVRAVHMARGPLT